MNQYFRYPVKNYLLRALQCKTIPKIRINYGSGWVGSGFTRKKIIGKSSENIPLLVLILWGSIQCLFVHLHTLLKVISHYDLSVVSMSVMGFQKKFG